MKCMAGKQECMHVSGGGGGGVGVCSVRVCSSIGGGIHVSTASMLAQLGGGEDRACKRSEHNRECTCGHSKVLMN